MRHKFQTRKLFGEYRIRKMEMGYKDVRSGARSYSGEMDIYVSRENFVPHLSVYKIHHDEIFPLSFELEEEGRAVCCC